MVHVVSQLGSRRCLALFGLYGALSATIGCGAKSGDRVPISGGVTFDGQPLEQGQVVFEPHGRGRMAIGQIVGGHYAIAAEKGPTAGDYVVRITASRPTGQMASTGSMSADELREVHEQFLPARYNDVSELSIQIDATSAIERDFDLQSR